MSTNENLTGPLHGVRVLDLTTMVAGPVATMMLADQGADVIKVETPSGDLMRRLAKGRKGMNAFFLACNRNKRSLAVDLKTEHGREIVYKLIATADVLVHNFRPGTAERIGVGEDAIRAIRHDIIYVSISGFGERGPYAGQRAYDPIIQALSGLADIQRDRDTGRPRMVRTIIADYTTALTAAQAITAALFARHRSAQGQHVRISMLDAMISYLWPEAMPSLTFVGEERDPSDARWGRTSYSQRKIDTSRLLRCRTTNGRACAVRSTGRISSMTHGSRPPATGRSMRLSAGKSFQPNWRNGPRARFCRVCSPTMSHRRRR
jgi:crotonobetainyl-CoA:carnitine CoA-transferase CaiB-like acyl-CoA transferase